MALSALIVWEGRFTGNDGNGGGFKTGASGTDFSQQDAAQATLTTAATVHTTTTQINVPVGEYVVSANDVGNVVQVTGGTATAGPYEITAVDVPNNRWTVDRAVGTAGQTVAGKMGGALASPGILANLMANSNIGFLKYNASPYLITSTTPRIAGGTCQHVASSANKAIIGYDTTRTTINNDANRPTVKVSGVTGATVFSHSTGSNKSFWRNLIVDGDSLASTLAFTDSALGAGSNVFERCTAKNCPIGFTCGSSLLVNCYTESCTSGFNGGVCWFCEAKGGTTGFTSGISIAAFCVAHQCSGIGFDDNAFASHYLNCVAYDCGSHGFSLLGNSAHLVNCISYGHSGAGFQVNANPSTLFYCASGGNSSGNYSGGTPFLEMPALITLTADPFIDGPNGNFALNFASGGGMLLRSKGYPTNFGSGLTVSYLDIGAVQHKDFGARARSLIGI